MKLIKPTRRSLILAAPALLLASKADAFWQSRDSNYNANVVSGGGSSPAWTKTAAPAIQNIAYSGATTVTFSSVAIGAASSNRIVIVNVCANHSASNSVTCTIDYGSGATSATLAVANSSSGTGPIDAIFYLAAPTGTTATIVLTATGTTPTFGYVGITVGALTGVTATPTSTATQDSGYNADPQVTTSALTVPATGFGLVVGGGGGGPPTWNVGTQDYYTTSAGLVMTSGYISASGSQTPSISGFSYAFFGMVAATWGP